MDEDATISRHRLARRLALACKIAAMASFLLCMPPLRGMAGSVVLVGPLVLAPAGYEVSLLLAFGSLFLALASWVVRKQGSVERDVSTPDGECAAFAGLHPGRPGSAHLAKGALAKLSARTMYSARAARWLVNAVTTLALLASISIAGFECLLAAPYIADPAGPAGDRVVVVESSVLLASYGDVYLVPGGCGVGRKVASYSVDGGYSPMGNGTYTLEWDGLEPRFTALGTPATPVKMCPAE